MGVPTFQILCDGKEITDDIQISRISVKYAVNRIPFAEIELYKDRSWTDEHAGFSNTEWRLGTEVKIGLGDFEYSKEPETVFVGQVCDQQLTYDNYGIRLTVGLKSKANLLTHQRKSQLFSQKRDSDIFQDLVAGAGLKTNQVDKTSDVHANMVQYHCTDWDFLLSRAKANQQLIVINENGISLITPSKAAKPQITLSAFDFISRLRIGITAPTAESSSDAWDRANSVYKEAPLRAEVEMQGTTKLELLDRVAFDDFMKKPTDTLQLTAIQHEVEAGLWTTKLSLGLHPDVYPDFIDVMDRPAAGLLPGINGLQLGIVADDKGEAGTSAYRLGVRIARMEGKADVLWARPAASLFATDDGADKPSPVGQEVVVGFFNDDPRDPIVLGMINNQPIPITPVKSAMLTLQKKLDDLKD